MKKETLDNLKIEDFKNGYSYNEEAQTYECIICGKKFKKGFLYEVKQGNCIAERAIQIHIDEDHNGTLDFLLDLDKRDNGLNDIQKKLLKDFSLLKKDKDISDKTDLSLTNIRNHRYRLRERYRQDKVFLAIMELVEMNLKRESNLVKLSGKSIPQDDRSVITKKEETEAIKKFFDSEGKVLNFPKKQKKKLIILNKIIDDFEKGRSYSEKEVNEILKNRYFDFVTLRRYMIDYGFLRRNENGTDYRVKE